MLFRRGRAASSNIFYSTLFIKGVGRQPLYVIGIEAHAARCRMATIAILYPPRHASLA